MGCPVKICILEELCVVLTTRDCSSQRQLRGGVVEWDNQPCLGLAFLAHEAVHRSQTTGKSWSWFCKIISPSSSEFLTLLFLRSGGLSVASPRRSFLSVCLCRSIFCFCKTTTTHWSAGLSCASQGKQSQGLCACLWKLCSCFFCLEHWCWVCCHWHGQTSGDTGGEGARAPCCFQGVCRGMG